MSLAQDVQKADLGELVTLYELDASSLGARTYYFCPAPPGGGARSILWQGRAYVAVPIEAEGFEVSAQGPLPRPKLRVPSAGGLVASLARQYGMLLGSVLTRRRTLSKYLDGEEEFPPEIYLVSRVSAENSQILEWELRSVLDLEQLMLPGRQVLRDACTQRYRRWTGSGFDYTRATCPYTGDGYFTREGLITTEPSQDVCGKRLSDCRLRFPGGPLPTWAFPGVARVRV